VTDAELIASADTAETTERLIRRHLMVTKGAFEQDRGWAAYRGAVALRKALEQWAATRAERKESK
jgi:hypothetical protein